MQEKKFAFWIICLSIVPISFTRSPTFWLIICPGPSPTTSRLFVSFYSWIVQAYTQTGDNRLKKTQNPMNKWMTTSEYYCSTWIPQTLHQDHYSYTAFPCHLTPVPPFTQSHQMFPSVPMLGTDSNKIYLEHLVSDDSWISLHAKYRIFLRTHRSLPITTCPDFYHFPKLHMGLNHLGCDCWPQLQLPVIYSSVMLPHIPTNKSSLSIASTHTRSYNRDPSITTEDIPIQEKEDWEAQKND